MRRRPDNQVDDWESLAERFRGLKPPRFPTVFEALVNGIACQQVTLMLGIRLLNRLAETYGPRRSNMALLWAARIILLAAVTLHIVAPTSWRGRVGETV